jgi:hypothetical protein
MTPEQAREAAKVLNQWADNPELTVQARHLLGGIGWFDTSDTGPDWDFSYFEYRIKPEPKTLWVVVAETVVFGTYHDKAAAVEVAENRKSYNARVAKFVEQEE